jgi:hypothetical protein
MATGITMGDSLEIGATRMLFETALPANFPRQAYDVAPDGRLLLNEVLEAGAPPITIVLNWEGLLLQ